jgi:hypothetical protein
VDRQPARERVDFLVSNNILPLTSIFIEPAKVLFLNNAINHGVLTPLGTNEAKESGKSILFLLEANPAAGLGLLLAYMVFGKGMAKASASGAAIIHFFGGIHEIYFPYVLAKPKLILAMMAGGATQIATNLALRLRPARPGCTRLDHRGLLPDPAQLPRCHRLGDPRCGGQLHRRGLPAAPREGRRRRGRPHRRDRFHGGDEGQEVVRGSAP